MSASRSRWTWWLIRLSRRIWFRAAVFALLGIGSALLAVVLAPFLPNDLSNNLGADSVGNILEILASSMLIVATFSLQTMTSAYAAASSSTTPRVTELLLQDSTAHNALSTFVGGFLFALAGIVGLSSGIYGDNGHLVLFVLTLVVIAIIVVTFLTWVEALSHFGRVPDAINRTANAAAYAMRERLREPFLGGRPEAEAEADGVEVLSPRMGYVRNIDMRALQLVAEKIDGQVIIAASPGTFLDGGPVARISGDDGEAVREAICAAFDVGDTRTFDQDPNYGISALAEIGVKALSPAISDPKTAQRVIDRLINVLVLCANSPTTDPPRCDRVFVPPLDLDELYADAFAELALYGASDVLIGVRLQQAFRTLCRTGDAAHARAAREQSRLALERARHALSLEADVQRLEALAEQVQADS
ncbi:MAG TPA: DUF2254 domain-containing protein [Woeseiaceae bacterium]|nr:DUF2254 domain-containing protein [Woeseiaceae bacterium]